MVTTNLTNIISETTTTIITITDCHIFHKLLRVTLTPFLSTNQQHQTTEG